MLGSEHLLCSASKELGLQPQAFKGVPPLVRVLFHLLLFGHASLSDWVIWNLSCRYDPFR